MIKRPLYFLLLTACTAVVFTSCMKNQSEMPANAAVESIYRDNGIIREYLRSRQLDSGLVIHPSGLCYKVVKEGNGRDSIRRENIPVVVFKRYLLPSEKLIESSLGLPTSFDGRKLKDHIAGWQIGLPQITKGGRIIMYIPSALAFGTQGVQNIIPPNAILICDVTLVDIK
ncbi:FKBP-type peptidyl-prolyl cis-trans isomerase [Chitinophaga alhagiae]|uniref:FKBP-type peptidyl-prolyl cis-trans isomerase n=1 Tax=Chitinophaga alhagiae TaxID=2203219 RepID=UPI0013004841|nr:FKBP-type peptidyl-prolyl cis-trans isomerase [Chitinophaga alhagiae]